jgi:hypothetical protein
LVSLGWGPWRAIESFDHAGQKLGFGRVSHQVSRAYDRSSAGVARPVKPVPHESAPSPILPTLNLSLYLPPLEARPARLPNRIVTQTDSKL